MQGNDIESASLPGSDHPDAVVDTYYVNGSRYDVVYSTSSDAISVYAGGQKAEPAGENTFILGGDTGEIKITRQLAYGYYELVIERQGQVRRSGRPSGTQAGERNTRTMIGYGLAVGIMAILFREMQDGKVGLPELLMTVTAAVVIVYARRVSRGQKDSVS